MVTLPPWPIFEPDELAAVEEVLRSGKVNYWTGTACREFEAAWSAAHGAGGAANRATSSSANSSQPHSPLHSLCMANGSLTLDAAIRALDIGPGDEVIVSPRSYVASAMCVSLAGATPVFADVDSDSGCITPATIDAVRSSRTRCVIPVHIGGWPCDMLGIMRWATPHGVTVIEDCAQSHGGHISGRPLGTFGTIASWSFCQDKIMSTGGEGGLLATADLALWKRCWSYAQHGKDHDAAMDGAPSNGFRWLVQHEGTNLRLTEMQAAIGICQLRKLQGRIAARRRNSLIMQEALSGVPGLRVPATPDGHAHYRCTAYTTGANAAVLKTAMLSALQAAAIPAAHGSCGEIYLEPYFADRGLTPTKLGRGHLDADSRLPVARLLSDTSLTFFVHHTISEPLMREYASAVRACLLESLPSQLVADRR